MAKYFWILKTSVSDALVYTMDFIGRSGFFAFIMAIYLMLWQAIYSQGRPVIDGFSLQMMIWYLVFTEIVTLSTTNYFQEISEDVKTGQIAYLLNKPFHYVWYCFFNHSGKLYFRFLINGVIGILIGLLFVGGLIPESVKGASAATMLGWLVMTFISLVLGIAINYFINFSLALSAFWVEENMPFRWIFQKLVFTLGGMLLPLDLFPEWLKGISQHLPFAFITYGPAKLGVAFEWSLCGTVLLGQVLYLAASIIIALFVYQKGVKGLNVNGG